MSVAQAGAAEPRRRLHPLTPFLRSGRLAALAIAAISWQGYQELGTQGWLMAIGGVAVLVLIGSVISWAVTGYHVVGRELRVYEGFIWRRTRAIPLERLQSVELVRPLLARALGLAELRLEVVGASKTEAPLAFLTVQEALELRTRLLHLAGRTSAPVAPVGVPHQPTDLSAPVPAAAPPERPIHGVGSRELLLSQLLRPAVWFIPLGIAYPIFYFANANDLGFIAVASMVTAIIGVVQGPLRMVLGEWGFTIAIGADGLRIHRGLTERRSQVVPAGRIQSVDVEYPLLWRPMGWLRASMKVAGVNNSEREQHSGGWLLPVGDAMAAERILGEVLPGFSLASVSFLPAPSRAGYLMPFRHAVVGYQLTPVAFVCRDGLITRQVVVVAYDRVQSVRVTQGPLQRLLRLASVWVDTAGGGAKAVALHRDAREAKVLASHLAEVSRAARAARRLEKSSALQNGGAGSVGDPAPGL